MALIEREVGAAVAATAVALSPKARRIVRQGAVYGLAGAVKAGDVVVSTARGAVRGAARGMTGRGEDGAAESPAAESSAPESQTTSEPASPPRRATRARTTGSAGGKDAADES